MVFGQDSLKNVEFQGKPNKTKTFGRLNWPIVSVSNLPSIFIGRKKKILNAVQFLSLLPYNPINDCMKTLPSCAWDFIYIAIIVSIDVVVHMLTNIP